MSPEIYPCLLMLNDMHIGKENIPDFTANWNEALNVCAKLDIHQMALCGDLFLARAAQTLDVLLAVHDALLLAAVKGIHITLANGNHCKVNQESEKGYCHVFDQHHNVHVADTYTSLPIGAGDIVVHMIAYFPENGSFCDKLDSVKAIIDPEKRNFLYLHEGINGALAQPSDSELPTKIFDGFEKVFVGHYHNRCVIPKTAIEYIGSSRQFNFGEDEQKGYTVLYSDGSHEFILNQVNTRYKTIGIDADKVDVHLMDLLDEIKADGRYRVKVRVHTNSAKANTINKTELLSAGASKVEVVVEDVDVEEVVSSSLFEKFDWEKINDSYKEFCLQKEIENVELGLHYLSMQ